METSFILNAILGVIILIVFLYMGSNISAIRKELTDIQRHSKSNIKQEYLISYYCNLTIGDKQKAYEDLTSVMFWELINTPIENKARSIKYEALKLKQSIKFEALGQKFPEYPW